MKKEIYIIRHGESEGNVQKIIQAPDLSLTDLGKEQARLVAARLEDIEIESIVCSPFKRAHQTAEIIAASKNLELKELEYIHERLTPSSHWGMKIASPEYQEILPEWLEKWHGNERFEDAETLGELFERTKQLREFLENSEHNKIAVVSHGHFIRTFLA